MLRPRNSHPGIHKRPHGNLFPTHEDEKSCHGTAKTPHLLTNCDSINDASNPSGSHTVKVPELIRSQSFPPQRRCCIRYVLNVQDVVDQKHVNEQNCSSNLKSDLNSLAAYNIMDITTQIDPPIVVEEMIGVEIEKTPIVKLPLVVLEENSVKVISHDVMDPSLDAVPLALNIVDKAPVNSVTNPLPALDSSSCGRNPTAFPKMPPSGKLLFCGRRREMEDTASIITPFINLRCRVSGECKSETDPQWQLPSDFHFFGVYDGHGGSQASLYCRERFHDLLAGEVEKAFNVGDAHLVQSTDEWNMKWDEVMKATFMMADKEVGGICPNGIRDEDDTMDSGCLCCVDAIAPENVGTTAVVAVIGSGQIIVANCGDSRAVLARGNTAIPMSRDHKPEIEEETRRIEDAGGRVIRWDGYRVGGLLALSRAIGDRYLKRYVISEPEVRCIERMSDDECLILATDGLWDVVDNEFACEVARKCLFSLRKKYKSRPSPPGEDPAAAAAAALLVKLAYGRGSKDNISVVVVDLKARSCG